MRPRPLSVPETAERLGVIPQRVRALVDSGDLAAERAGGVWLVDADAVARRALLAELGATSAAVRPWSTSTAWTVMRALDGDDELLRRLDRKARYRLRRQLDAAAPARLLSAVRNRGTLVRASLHPTRVERLRAMVVASGPVAASAHGSGLSGADPVDGYLTADALVDARGALMLRPAPSGPHLLRVVDDARLLDGLVVAPRLAVAADLLDHAVTDGATDARVVATIRRLLAELGAAPTRSGPPR